MPEASIGDILAVVRPEMSDEMHQMTQLPSRSIGRANQSARKPINDKGYKFSIQVGHNPQHGGMASGSVMLVGGRDRYLELCIGSVVSNGARAWDGTVLRHQEGPKYIGLSVAQQLLEDADNHATEHNKNLCFGGLLYNRGVVASVAHSGGISTVTFDAAQGGSYFLSETEGASYWFHLPSGAYTAHGTGPAAFPLIDIPTPTTARFTGDLTGGTTVAAGDLCVPNGTADGVSSINKGIRNFEYFCATTGDYFTGNRDAEPKLRGIRFDADGDEITRATLEFVDGLYTFKWPQDEMGTKGHVDFISPTQRAKILFQGDPLWRLNDQSYKNYDPKSDFKGWGGREYICDVHLLDTNWFTILLKFLYHYEQKAWDVWDYDGLNSRAIPSTGSIRDAKQTHYIAVDQYGHEFPGKNIQIFNASTSGAPLKTS